MVLVIKNLPASAGDTRGAASISRLGKFPWSRKWQPVPIFLPGKSLGQRSLAGHSPWVHKESDTTEGPNRQHTFGEGERNPTTRDVRKTFWFKLGLEGQGGLWRAHDIVKYYRPLPRPEGRPAKDTDATNRGPESGASESPPEVPPTGSAFPGNRAVTVDSASLSSAQKTKGTVDQRLSRFSRVWLFASLWTVAHQTLLSMEFSRQNYCSGLP